MRKPDLLSILRSKSSVLTFKEILLDSGEKRPELLKRRLNYFAASKEHAFLDVLYLNKDYHFDNLSPLDLKKIRFLLAIYNNKSMDKRLIDISKILKQIGNNMFSVI